MIYLTGFMGSGKTVVGRKLASLMHRPLIDMDELITTRTGSSIPDIFKHAGEKAFRAIEQDVLREIAAGEDAVVSTGGGLPVDAANRALMKASGTIVHLRAGLETLKKRVGSGAGRPLWGKDIEALFEAREDAYADADLIIDTDNLNAETVAILIQEKTRGILMPIPVVVKERPYPVYIGRGILSGLKDLIFRHLQPEGLFVLIDQQVAALHATAIRDGLDDIHHHSMEVPAGEGSKSYGFLEEVLGRMLGCGMNRGWACMAIGGGVTGDLAGFAANIFMRGIPVIQVPTTLLAQVDSSVGGKTAINHARGKNLIGTFYQPAFVLCDTTFFDTLPPVEIKGGLSEVVKYGIIMDTPLFEYLESPEHDYERIVRMCCRDKAAVVARDEREGNLRRILNFGHTLGHAVEKCSSFQILHGQAVAYGMVFATWLSHDLGILSLEDKKRVFNLINRLEIIPDGLHSPPRQAIGEAMAMDKKAEQDGVHFVLVSGIGEATVKQLSLTLVLDAYERFIRGFKTGV